MIYLIFKMALYLLAALAGGGAAGWLLRNVSAVKTEDELQRTVTELRAKLAQLESLLRSRDDQLNKLRAQSKDKDARLGELRAELGVRDRLVERKDREHGEALARQGAGAAEGLAPSVADADARVAELSAELARLHSELSETRVRAAAAQMPRGPGVQEEQLRAELQALESELKQTSLDGDRLTRLLEQERRKVVELERERELQSKSLQLLHQQLDLERGRASGQA